MCRTIRAGQPILEKKLGETAGSMAPFQYAKCDQNMQEIVYFQFEGRQNNNALK